MPRYNFLHFSLACLKFEAYSRCTPTTHAAKKMSKTKAQAFTFEDQLDHIEGEVVAYMAGKRGMTEEAFRTHIHGLNTKAAEDYASYQRKIARGVRAMEARNFTLKRNRAFTLDFRRTHWSRSQDAGPQRPAEA